MRILVVRHAIAEDREEYQERARRAVQKHAQKRGEKPHPVNDDFRPLTDAGMRKMKKVAKGLPGIVERPDLLLSSPLLRAVETAEILRGAWREDKSDKKLDIRVVEWLRPDSSPDDLVEGLSGGGGPDARDDSLVAIVGHEPHLSQLVSWLIGGSRHSRITLKKGGACLIEFDGRPARGEGRLRWLATPKML